MSSSKNSNENNTQNSVVPILPPIPNLVDHLMLGPWWVADVDFVPRTEPSLTPTPHNNPMRSHRMWSCITEQGLGPKEERRLPEAMPQ